jgi:hypothetical protein
MRFAQRSLLLAGALFACQFSVGVAKTAAVSANNALSICLENALVSSIRTFVFKLWDNFLTVGDGVQIVQACVEEGCEIVVLPVDRDGVHDLIEMQITEEANYPVL